MSNFKVGDKVCMSEIGKDSYNNTPCNPHNEIGKVSHITACGTVRVDWNFGWNTYHPEDLELVEEDTSEIFEPQPFKGFKSITLGALVYYFATEEQREEVLKDLEPMYCLRMASIVINKETNSIVKMRYDLKQLFDEVLK